MDCLAAEVLESSRSQVYPGICSWYSAEQQVHAQVARESRASAPTALSGSTLSKLSPSSSGYMFVCRSCCVSEVPAANLSRTQSGCA